MLELKPLVLELDSVTPGPDLGREKGGNKVRCSPAEARSASMPQCK